MTEVVFTFETQEQSKIDGSYKDKPKVVLD